MKSGDVLLKISSQRVYASGLALILILSFVASAYAETPTPAPASAVVPARSPSATSAPATIPSPLTGTAPTPPASPTAAASPSTAGSRPAASDTGASAPNPPASASPGVLVPGGTTVLVSLAEPLSSATAKADDQVAIVVQKDVVVAGRTVISKGANGHATVVSSEGAASNGSGGKLALNIDWVYSVDGGKIKLSSSNHNAEESDSKGAASTATLLSWSLLGPLGFFAHNFVRGKQAIIGTDKKFIVFVDKDVHVSVGPGTEQDAGFDH